MSYRELAQKELPYNGEFFFSKNRKYQELIFFVHFYEGRKRNLLRHIKKVNELGYDAFAFNLEGDFQDLGKLKLPFTPNRTYGLKHSYSFQIDTLLDLIPGTKIVFSFSNPSASAIESINRRNARDIAGLICDSGPSGYFIRSGINLFNTELRKRRNIWLILSSPFISLSWSPYLHHDVRGHLMKLPKDFPILTIEGGKDLIIPVNHIERIFSGIQNINWQRHSIPDAGHLNGLRDYGSLYERGLISFLESISHLELNSND